MNVDPALWLLITLLEEQRKPIISHTSHMYNKAKAKKRRLQQYEDVLGSAGVVTS